MAFQNVHPQAPIHFLLIPKKPIQRLRSANQEDATVRLSFPHYLPEIILIA